MPVTAKGDIDKEAKDIRDTVLQLLWFRDRAQQAGALRAQQAPLQGREGPCIQFI